VFELSCTTDNHILNFIRIKWITLESISPQISISYIVTPNHNPCLYTPCHSPNPSFCHGMTVVLAKKPLTDEQWAKTTQEDGGPQIGQQRQQ
jgi:hypothetical protein